MQLALLLIVSGALIFSMIASFAVLVIKDILKSAVVLIVCFDGYSVAVAKLVVLALPSIIFDPDVGV